MIFYLLICCVSDSENKSIFTSVEIETDSNDKDLDSANIVEPICPIGFVAVPDESQPVFCIMAYEASIQDEVLESIANVLPAANVSFYSAQSLCETIKEGADDDQRTARLASYEEWLDAGDGVIGEGGGLYPWGDEYAPHRCVLPVPEQGIIWDDYQQTGSMRDCVSRNGVFDQLGNVWEWVDEGKSINISDWLLNQAQLGQSFQIQDGHLYLLSGSITNLYPQVVGFSFSHFQVDELGRVWAIANSPYPLDKPGIGYILPTEPISMPETADFLPMNFAFSEDRHQALVVVDMERDGEPVATKVGGAYYSGTDQSLRKKFYGHVPTFDGSIGFRCSIEPMR
jgi:hypothetical protein